MFPGFRSRAGVIGVVLASSLSGNIALDAQMIETIDPRTAAYPGFEQRYGIPEGTKLAALVDTPTLVSMIVDQFSDPASGEHRMSGFGDAQAIYDVPLQAVADVLQDYEGQKAYSSSLFEVRVESREGPRTIVYQDLGMSFLGLKASYKIRVEVMRDEFSNGAVGIRARLVESVDHKLYASFSSWYLEPVIVDGKNLLYLRIFTGSGIRRPIIGMAAASKGFTPGNLKGQLRDTVKETRRRLGIK